MSAVLIGSLVIRLFAVFLSLRIFLKHRDLYVFWFGVMIALMALRQALTLSQSETVLPIMLEAKLDEFPGLIVSVLAILGLIATDRLVRAGRNQAISYQAELKNHEETTATLKRSEERFNLAMQGANDGLWDWSRRSNKVFFSPRWFEMLGYTPFELPGTHKTFVSLLHPEDREATIAYLDIEIAAGGNTLGSEFRMRHKNGSYIDVLSRALVICENGDVVRIVGTHVDITERKRTEAALRHTEEVLFEGIEALPVGFAYFDAADKLVVFNKNFRSLFPRSAPIIKQGMIFEDFIRNSAHVVAPAVGYDDVEIYVQERLASPRGPGRIWTHKQPTGRWVTMTEHPTSGGGFITIIEDITEERKRQSQLQQAQKMEAIGQLTGGIAHDFNNLLAVIQGNAELLQDAGGQHSAMASTIIRASGRGAQLTQRLLAFSRQQPLKPKVIDLCKMTTGMLDLFQRTLGETIKISTHTQENLWGALADPGQVEGALLNLTINARDAMPDGGELTIECANIAIEENNSDTPPDLASGDYVVLSVTDNGEGMPEEVQKHAFEPFFTTKEFGKGSGLGLSMVYGFARQSGGQATIYSEEGKGTTLKLYLPRAHSEVASLSPSQPEAAPQGQGETILVIEDDPEVRKLAKVMLRKLSYKVVSAEDISGARRAVEKHSDISLILSDVVLPGGTSGPEFAEELRTSQPEIKVIFMSGYPAKAAKRNGFLGSDSVLLNKPFRIAQLAKAVKKALN